MPLLVAVALKHLFARKRQTIVSLFGIVLGVAFFLAISSLMQGSERDFIRRLVDNSPHINIVDEYRLPSKQPVARIFPEGAVHLSGVKPVTEPRGIRGYQRIVDELRRRPGVLASPVLVGQALISYSGRDLGVTLNGVIATQINEVSTLHQYMIDGSIDDLIANPDGLIIGAELARKLSLQRGNNLTISSPGGVVRTLKLVGIFRTGRANYDESQAFTSLERAQSLFRKLNRANSIIVRLADPYRAYDLAASFESEFKYKCISWQEASEDLTNTLRIRNTIMYTVVSAVLIVAAFGIYNVISTIVMEKQRDIAILKSMGFHAKDVRMIFVIQGVVLGCIGCAIGLPMGSGLMYGLMQIRFKPPGTSVAIQMPIDWSPIQFCIAAGFAMFSAVIAAVLPANRGARVQPVEILRGGL